MKKNSLIHKLAGEYLICLFGVLCVLLSVVYIMLEICNSRIWYGTEFLYPLLHLIHTNLGEVIAIVCLTGWLFVTIIFAVRMWLYLREVVRASEQMALHTEVPVKMSGHLKEVQDELNSVRELVLQNERKAKEAEQRKSDMIVYLAHDLKTPLTSVIGYLTLLKDEPELTSELRARYTGIAYDKAQRLEQLINEFFEITRLNLTTMELNRSKINFSLLLEQTANEFLPLLEEKGLTWELSIEPGIFIVCDPDKLERVFDNLIRNAIFYCYEKSKLKLSLSRRDEYAWVRMENCGRTISKEKLSHIFEQFYRLDDARSTDTGGAGLGLAIAKEIVELHGGHIEAESEEEKIRFLVWLPVFHDNQSFSTSNRMPDIPCTVEK